MSALAAAPESAAAAPRPEEFVDALFALSCRSLPVDHAWPLAQAVCSVLPWLAEEPRAGIHLVNVATSGAGWRSPEEPDALLQLSRRAKLALRLPRKRLEEANALVGRTLQVAGWPMGIERLSARPLAKSATLFSRAVILATGTAEGDFLAAAAGQLAALGVRPQRLLCGRASTLATPQRTHHARSLMLAGVTLEHSLVLQERGLGAERRLGCGLFVPCKDIGDLRTRDD